MKQIVYLCCIGLLASCGTDSTPQDTQAAPAVTELPPGFTDAPPPAPTSATTVLSGGILYAEQANHDAAIVISNGLLVSWGKRGEVSMPNDSIGVDMRGKWIVPGVVNTDGSLTLTSLPAAGEAAAFLIFNDQPAEQPDSEGLVGTFADGELQMDALD